MDKADHQATLTRVTRELDQLLDDSAGWACDAQFIGGEAGRVTIQVHLGAVLV